MRDRREIESVREIVSNPEEAGRFKNWVLIKKKLEAKECPKWHKF